MADEEEQEQGQRSERNGVQWAVMGTLVLLLAVLAVVGASLKPSPAGPMGPPPPPDNARALLVPTDDASRTVVIPPCGIRLEQLEQRDRIPGLLRLRLPRGPETRAVVVPNCLANRPAAEGPGAAAAFVLPVGTERLDFEALGVSAESQVVLPPDAAARTVVIPRCAAKIVGSSASSAPTLQRRRDIVLSGEADERGIIAAPRC